MDDMSPLQKERLKFQPSFPKILQDFLKIYFEGEKETGAIDNIDELKKLFPHTFGRPFVETKLGERHSFNPLRIGVVFSGGQAAGGHNVITGLFDAFKKMNAQSQLFGFLSGPSGIIENHYIELTDENIAHFRNQGGFDLIGSGRTKIETDEQLARSLSTLHDLKIDGLVIIGGDDSNTNAAILAEYFLEKESKTTIVGIPKTIDGDLKNEQVEISFGFDTASKVYSEMIGNLARDTLSAKKYYHFVKLMGRSASHISLECALSTHPNFALIAEEVASKKQTISQVTQELSDLICMRADIDKNYGIILIPEGLIEFIPEMKVLIKELNQLLATPEFSDDVFHNLLPKEKRDHILKQLTPATKETFNFLPDTIQYQLLLDRDPHGNVQVSKISTESLFIETVEKELQIREEKGIFKGKFNALAHFFGYEGRSGFPSNFDATYCYALGYNAALLLNQGLTGYMSVIKNLSKPVFEWQISGIPITSMMNLEMRKGKLKPVINKALVDLKGAPFAKFREKREKWMLEDNYRFPGPIQYAGDPALTNAISLTLSLEH